MRDIVRKIAPKFLLSWYHLGLAFLGAALYGFPSRKLIVIGVTGTNGKSTTVDMISRIFREAGLKTASLSSIRFQILDREWRNTMKMTMPGRFIIQRFLRRARDAGCTHFVLEVTSEGILQHRHRFINFHTAVFTNLSPEHIERHGSFENYKRTKGKLFQITKEAHVINVDDENAEYFLQFPAEKIFRYGAKSEQKMRTHDLFTFAHDIQGTPQGTGFFIDNTKISLQLLGSFNAYNALAALAVAKDLGIAFDISKRALEKMEVMPGRMEQVVQKPFRVIVDYAFTPAALEKVYKTLNTKNYKLICVLGAAGGGRDRWKRPVLGKLAATYCDRIIVTNEDPYDEDPTAIMQQVAQGTERKAEIIPDRREAIRKGLSFASPGDTVVITGKGSEDSIAVKGGKKIPWDDRGVVREEFQKL